ncbi:hypothetical protein EAH88_11665 [Rhodanobacter glycinis]|uniref:Uncharacterized protein n=2 Tax=Rhodanobacter glycinis TaxID=582702 RepID=A0A502C6L3_9GAMM|nr:hypothetical protein EAH88_11665 [Rhodanobacter glycinis]
MDHAEIRMLDLAVAIADHTARSDVECYARIASNPIGQTRYDLSQAQDVPGDEVVAQRAAEYIRLRGDILPYKLVCVDETVFFEDVRSCRVCGCTDGQACPGGCSWVGPDLCSACVDEAQED